MHMAPVIQRCAAANCNNTSAKQLNAPNVKKRNFFQFPNGSHPSGLQRRAAWIHASGNRELIKYHPSKRIYLCDAHFKPSDYMKTDSRSSLLFRNCVPSIFEHGKPLGMGKEEICSYLKSYSSPSRTNTWPSPTVTRTSMQSQSILSSSRNPPASTISTVVQQVIQQSQPITLSPTHSSTLHQVHSESLSPPMDHDYCYPASLFDSKNQDWAPSLHLGHDSLNKHRIDSTCPTRPPVEKFQDGSENSDRKVKHLTENDEDPLHGETQVGALSTFDCQKELVHEPVVMDSESSVLPEENTMESVNFSVNREDAVCDASVETHLCCDELDELKKEREGLLQELVCFKVWLSESRRKVECYNEILSEKNLSLAEKNSEIKNLEKKIEKLEATISLYVETCNKLKSSLCNFSFNEDSLKEDNSKIGYYTGLPSFTTLMLVFSLVSEKVRDSAGYTLPKFQQFFMVLMWLRLGLEEQDLAYRFGVSQSTVSRILYRWLIPMSNSLEKFIVWPDRESLQSSMPFCFEENFKKSVVVIIDCFEVFIKHPLLLVSRADIGSQYKVHNTVKFLIGITPQGRISYISRAWAGGVSDKDITEQCGLLDKLSPDDFVVADRGFDIADAVGTVGAKLVIPASTKGKPQLSFDDVQLTENIANVRIHVEWVIGVVRNKYRIFRTSVPVEFLTKNPGDDLAPIDHLARVCCALTNLCAPLSVK